MTKEQYSHFSLGEEVMVEIRAFHAPSGMHVTTMHPGIIRGKFLADTEGKDPVVVYSVKLDGASKCFDCPQNYIRSA